MFFVFFKLLQEFKLCKHETKNKILVSYQENVVVSLHGTCFSNSWLLIKEGSNGGILLKYAINT